MRLRSVGASGSPRMIQSLLVFAALGRRPRLFGDRAAASCFGTSALGSSLVVLFLGRTPVRLAAALRPRHAERYLSRGLPTVLVHEHPAAAYRLVLVKHSVNDHRYRIIHRAGLIALRTEKGKEGKKL